MYSEQQLAYLNAMGIIPWQDRTIHHETSFEAVPEASVSHDDDRREKVIEQGIGQALSSEAINRPLKESPSNSSEPAENAPSNRVLNRAVSHVDSSTNAAPTSDVLQGHSTSGYLVNQISERWLQKDLLVICQHEKGQPFESFVRRGKPSKTVTNLMSGILQLLDEGDNELSINFAQMTTTPLSERAMPTTDVLTEFAPKAILIFGELAANQLFQTEKSLSEWQLKHWMLNEQLPVVVTYHPYDIFKNPIIKRQVMTDVLRLVDRLKHVRPQIS